MKILKPTWRYMVIIASLPLALLVIACLMWWPLSAAKATSSGEQGGVASTQPVHDAKTKAWLKSVEEDAARDNGHIMVIGKIIDEDGKLLNDVRMDISKGKSMGYGRVTDERETRTVSGEFKLDYKGYMIIVADIYKEGYYNERITCQIKPQAKDIQKTSLGDTVVKNEDKDVKIVMEKIGVIPKLHSYDMSIKLHGKSRPSIVQIKEENDSIVVEGRTLDAEKIINHNAMVIWVDTDNAGIIQTVKINQNVSKEMRNNYFHDLPPVVLPARVHLMFPRKNGGFIRFGNPGENTVFRQMKNAPNNGYEDELILGEKDWISLASVTPWSRGIYVYIKWGDRYGKGVIRDIKIDPSGNVELYWKLYLQIKPNEDHNVRTTSNSE